MAEPRLDSRQADFTMGQSSSQHGPQLVEELEVNGTQEKRKKSKKRKSKKHRDSGEHAQEEEIARALLDMKDSQIAEHAVDAEGDDVAAASQLLTEGSPTSHPTSAMVNGGPVQPERTAKQKRQAQKDAARQGEELVDGSEIFSYLEDLLETGSQNGDQAGSGARGRAPEVTSSQLVPSLDSIDSDDENIAQYLREYNGHSSAAEPKTPDDHIESNPEINATVGLLFQSGNGWSLLTICTWY